MSSEDLESLIVSDESLLDPSVDTSRLRRTTDTRQELLGDLQPGLQYDPTLQSTYSDLLRYFSGDLDIAPVSTVTTPAVGSPTDEGGGGGGTIGTGSGGQETESEGIAGFDPGVTPGLSGFIGLDPDMDVSPFEVDDAQTYEPTATSSTTQPIDPSGMLPQVSGMPSMLGDTGGSMDQMSSTMPANLGDTGGSMDQMSGAQQESALSEAFRKGKDALDSGVQTISQVGQSIADSVKGTYDDLEGNVDVPGLGKISVRDTLAGLAVNTLVGAPVSFVKYAMDKMPPSASQLEYEGYTASQKAAVDEAYGPGGVMEGYNAVSAFGDGPLDTMTDRYNTRVSNGIIDATTTDLANKINALGGNVDNFEDGGNGGDDRDTFGGVPGVPDAIGGNISKDYSYVDTSGGGKDQDPSGPSTDDFADDFDDYGGIGSITTGTLSGLGMLAKDGDGSGNTGGYTGGGGSGVPDAIGGGGDGGNGGCFLAGTLVTMADGSTKPVEQVDLKDNVAEGGKVFATGKFLVENLHDYKGIKVSGSHMVNEDKKWVRVENSKHGKPLGDDEHTVYVFGSENRRILINGILFTDYFEVKEQEKFLENEKKFFKNWKQFSNEHNESNVNILNAS